MIQRWRFEERGLMAIAPSAWGSFFDLGPRAQNERRDGVTIVSVRGPLMHHEHWCCDSYDAIKGRVLEALAEKPRAVVLSIDSPGGLVSGCFDTAQEIRAAALAAGVDLVTYVDGQALSAAYALACAATRIVTPATGSIGSIGVIEAMIDATKQDAQFGVAFKLIASGARKTDGNPHIPISDEAAAAVQRNVLAMADVFFAHVASARGLSADAIRSLQAATLIGPDAQTAKLADDVQSLDQLLAELGSKTSAPPAAAGVETMDPKSGPQAKSSKGYEDAIAALRKCAASDDAAESARAKRMLKAELDEPDGDEPAPKKEEGKAELDEPDGDEPKKEDGEAKAIAQQALAEAQKATGAIAAQAKAAVDNERKTLLASRPDLDEPTRALLASAPIDQVRDYVTKAPKRALKPAATAVVAGTRAEGQVDGDHADRLPADEAHALDVRMGLASPIGASSRQGTPQVIQTMTRAQARTALAGFEKREQEREKRELERRLQR